MGEIARMLLLLEKVDFAMEAMEQNFLRTRTKKYNESNVPYSHQNR